MCKKLVAKKDTNRLCLGIHGTVELAKKEGFWFTENFHSIRLGLNPTDTNF